MPETPNRKAKHDLHKKLWLGVLATVVISGFAATSAAQTSNRGGSPSLSLAAEPGVIRNCEGDAAVVRLNANASSSSGNPLQYKWSTNGGRISGNGANPTWDLSGVAPGVYQAVVDVDAGDPNCAAFSSVAVVVTECPPTPPPPPSCPTVTVECPDSAAINAPVTFRANVSGGSPNVTPSYNWTVSGGTITSGQGTDSITVDTTGLAGQTIRATLDVGGYGMPCPVVQFLFPSRSSRVSSMSTTTSRAMMRRRGWTTTRFSCRVARRAGLHHYLSGGQGEIG